jgi:hypothetical protein
VKPNELIRGVRKEKNKKWTQEKEHVTQMNWFETQKLKWSQEKEHVNPNGLFWDTQKAKTCERKWIDLKHTKKWTKEKWAC